MNQDDEVNVAYSQMVEAMGEEALAKFEQAEFDAEVDLVTNQFAKAADYYAGVFDIYVVTAALNKVWLDYDAAVGGDGT